MKNKIYLTPTLQAFVIRSATDILLLSADHSTPGDGLSIGFGEFD